MESAFEGIHGSGRPPQLRNEAFRTGYTHEALTPTALSKKILNFSVKILEIAEEKKAIAEYGSVDSGASLGVILGAAIEKKERDNK